MKLWSTSHVFRYALLQYLEIYFIDCKTVLCENFGVSFWYLSETHCDSMNRGGKKIQNFYDPA